MVYQKEKDKPNVLLIGVDQMRYDTAGCYGNPICKTPNIDRLAQEGTIFENAYTTCPLCSPARASMFTGLYAFKHGMGTNCDMYHSLARELSNPEQLLHYRLKDLGYNCAFAGKWHVGTEMGPGDYGFEGMNIPGYGDLKKEAEFKNYLKENNLSYGPVKDPIYGNPEEKTLLAGKWDGPVESTPSYYMANYTMDMLDKYADDEDPFFISCQFWGPHPPYLPSSDYVGIHDRDLIKEWENYNDEFYGKPGRINPLRNKFYRTLPEKWEKWQEIIGLCYDFTTMVDHQIGRILDHLKRLNLAQNTILIFTSDHGDMMGSHGGLFDKGYLYEEAMRIPLIVRYPDVMNGGNTSEQFIYNMDIMPTILDITGIPDNDLDGKSFSQILQGKSDNSGRDNIYMEFHGLKYLYSQRALINKDGYKYIFTPGDKDEFYDLNNDPGEMNNLLGDEKYTQEINIIRQQLIEKAKKVEDPLQDCVSKFFGVWKNLSGQADASKPIKEK